MPNPPTILFSTPPFYFLHLLSILFSLRLQELGLITKALRQRLRDDLRAYYKSHPAAMEPAPYLRSLTLGHRERILATRR